MKKKEIIIISIVWALLIALTITFVLVRNHQTKDENISKETNSKENLEGLSLYDTYTLNDLNVNYVKDQKENQYLQISGLKDTEIEELINKRLKEKYDGYNKTYGNQKDIKIETFLKANFGDILSVSFTVVNEGDEYDGYKVLVEDAMNISLKDGKDIPFEKLFTTKDIINSILTKEFSYSISYDLATSVDTDADNYVVNADKLAAIEDEVYKIVLAYNRGKGGYYVSNNGIYLFYGRYYANIDFTQYHDYLAYPTRYKEKESLYKENINDGVYTYVIEPDEWLYYQFGEENDNAFVDAIVYNGTSNDYDKKFDATKLSKSVNFAKIVNDKLASLDKSGYRYVNLSGIVDESENLLEYNYVIRGCTMANSYFENNLKEKLYIEKTYFRTSFDQYLNVSSLGDDDKNVKCTEETKIMLYDKKFNRISSLKDLFKSSYDYQSVIDEYFKEELDDDALFASAKDKLVCDFDIFSVNCSYDAGDIEFSIDYEEFDPSGLKV